MSYIGNQPQYTSFLSDTFSGNGSTTVFTMTVAPSNTAAVLVAIWGVLQDPTTYGVVGRILTFSQAPPTGVGNISVRYLALPASNITTTSYRSVSEFTATAGQTTFTPASYTPGFINVFRSGVRLGASNFTATNGVTVVLTNAAAAGDLITIESFFVSSVLNAIPNVAGAITPTLLDSTSQSGSGALQIPIGTTAQRPGSPTFGMIRANSTTGFPEWYSTAAGTWLRFSASAYSVEFLIIAGGGAGNNAGGVGGGGGGAGGYRTGTASFFPTQTFSVVVGAGGTGGVNTTGNGNNSTFNDITALGGGAGSGSAVPQGPNSGGSGGGAGSSSVPAAGSGTAGQGNAGGAGTGDVWQGGGGGGAGGTGGSSGGAGSTWLDGTTRAGGGGAGRNQWQGGGPAGYAGGSGGGGAGGYRTSVSSEVDGVAGTANTGSGGGGGGRSNSGSGGSGVVIIRYFGPQQGTGGTVTSAGGFTYHTFTASGTFTA